MGELSLASLMVLLSCIFIRITFWEASESFSDQWKQNKASMAVLDISPFCLYLSPQPTWDSILAATFLLKCRTEEVGHWWFQEAWTPSILCFTRPFFPHHMQLSCRRRLSISPSVWSCSLKLHFALSLVMVYNTNVFWILWNHTLSLWGG